MFHVKPLPLAAGKTRLGNGALKRDLTTLVIQVAQVAQQVRQGGVPAEPLALQRARGRKIAQGNTFLVYGVAARLSVPSRAPSVKPHGV